jgi:Sec-independent protein translocase protein TatA
MGRFFGQIQRMTSDITSSINEESFQADRQEARKNAATVVKAEPASADDEPADETATHDGEFVYDELKQDANDARVIHDKPGPPPLDEIEPPEDIPDDDKSEES